MLNGDYVIKYNRTPAKDGLTKASAEHAITGERLFGDVLNGMTAIGADGNTESTPADVMFPDPAVTIVSSNTADEIITLTPHGLAVGDYVFISGHSGSTPDHQAIQVGGHLHLGRERAGHHGDAPRARGRRLRVRGGSQ
jgi:hypothetical protein